MATTSFQSANGVTVRISVERKSASGIFGRDFVSGGMRDYFDKTKEGYWVIGKCHLRSSNLGALLRDAVQKNLGTYPLSMPETAVSHLLILLWEGSPVLDEEELLTRITSEISQGQLVEYKETTKMRELKRREAELKEELRIPNTSPLKISEWREVTEEMKRERLKQTAEEDIAAPAAGIVSESSLITEQERIVLISVAEGLEGVGSYLRDYKGIFEDLASQGFLRRVGIFTKHYELTDKGAACLE